MKIFGIEGEFKLITPEVLKDFDAVITIGRTVQYCLALGIPVYCYDRFGGPGWITESNIESASKFNFSGRCVDHFMTSHEIVHNIIKGFKSIENEITFYKSYARSHYHLGHLIDSIDNQLSQLNDPLKHNKQVIFKNIAFRQRQYWAMKKYNTQFLQLFLDYANGISEENSIKLPVLQNTKVQEFVFDLSDKPDFINIRLDPLNDACVIEIEELKLLTDRGERDLRDRLISNAMFHRDNRYFFDFNDPQIHVDSSIADDLSRNQKAHHTHPLYTHCTGCTKYVYTADTDRT